MARDSVRPFIVGLLFVYLLDPPVRWLVRRGVRRTIAILIVYLVAIVRHRRVPGAHVDAAGQRDAPVHRRLPEARGESSTPSSSGSASSTPVCRSRSPSATGSTASSPASARAAGGRRSARPVFLLPLVTGAGSLLGAIFGYLILPVWVFYLLKDGVAWSRQFDRVAAGSLAVRRLGGHPDRRARLRAMGPRPAHPRVHGRRLHVHRPDDPEPAGGPDLRALRRPAVDHRRRPGARPDHRADHLGGPGGPARGDAGPAAVVAALALYTLVQQVENNLLVPKIQGDAVELHPAAVMFAIIIGGALAGCSGRSWRCRWRPRSATSSATCSGAAQSRTSPRRSAISPRRASGMGPRRCADGRSTRTRSCRSTPRPRTRSSRPPIAASRANTTRTCAKAPEAADRMAAINAAWELIGEPAKRAAYDRERAAASHAAEASAAHPGTGASRREPAGDARDAARPPAPPHGARGGLARLDLGTLVVRRRLRRVDARRRRVRRGRPTARPPVGDRAQLRPLRRLVARRGRPQGPRVHRVARPRIRSAATYREEVDEILRANGRREAAEAEASDRRGLYRRR